jgi:quinolinate synthase
VGPPPLPGERDDVPQQIPLRSEYAGLDDAVLQGRLQAAREALGSRLLILAHHYQRDEIADRADEMGDSLKLAQLAAARREADHIVLCGVRFMAESADILTGPEQSVHLPNPIAGCLMADMATEGAAAACLDQLAGLPGRTLPVTYVNSSAEVKAEVGRRGGAVCTSSNAAQVLRWALERADRVLFLPDQHLGRNTAQAMGIPDAAMALWRPAQPWGGCSEEALRSARIVLWAGHCYVHQMFQVSHIRHLRKQDPGMRIIVHPECAFEVVQAADAFGSTAQIIRAVRESPPGSRWAVGTEITLVQRLARQMPDRTIVPLSRFGTWCANMGRTTLPHLLQTVEDIAAGQPGNRVDVPAKTAAGARTALERMLQLTG